MRQARRNRDQSIIQHTRAERSTGSYVAEHTDSTWTQTFPGVFLGACRERAISGVPASQQRAPSNVLLQGAEIGWMGRGPADHE